ncbi:MAG: hypothetical protein SFV51_06745 [Bryobacteraceae bacterium]|nr:hypothetical protein [Bryobacteraceae bacterium]
MSEPQNNSTVKRFLDVPPSRREGHGRMRFTFLLTFAANDLIYESHCGLSMKIANFDVRENQSMKNATKKAAKKAPAKKAAKKAPAKKATAKKK